MYSCNMIRMHLKYSRIYLPLNFFFVCSYKSVHFSLSTGCLIAFTSSIILFLKPLFNIIPRSQSQSYSVLHSRFIQPLLHVSFFPIEATRQSRCSLLSIRKSYSSNFFSPVIFKHVPPIVIT